MRVEVRHVLNEAEIRSLMTSPQAGIAKDMWRRGLRVEAKAKQLCPVDHGRLRASIHVAFVHFRGALGVEVGTDVEYAIWVHEGTGLHGPRRALIYPKRAKVMVFTPRKGRGGAFISARNRTTVFARYTRGMNRTPFLRDALPAARR